jgi:dienelactone hydrolase
MTLLPKQISYPAGDINIPGVNHSFIWPGDKYDRKAHLDSWDKTLQFLKTSLNSF